MQPHLSEIGLEQQLDEFVLLVQSLLAGQGYEPVAVQGVASLPLHAVVQSLLGKCFLCITVGFVNTGRVFQKTQEGPMPERVFDAGDENGTNAEKRPQAVLQRTAAANEGANSASVNTDSTQLHVPCHVVEHMSHVTCWHS